MRSTMERGDKKPVGKEQKIQFRKDYWGGGSLKRGIA